MAPTHSPSSPSKPASSHAHVNGSPGGAAAESRAGADAIAPSDVFQPRHIGPDEREMGEMLGVIGYASVDQLVDGTVPPPIRLRRPLALAGLPENGLSESEALARLKGIAAKNTVARSFIGQGYYDTITPPVILRNILENPGWYTQYTPYQAEISQGRLEALLNFQTMVSDLTGLPMAGASLLDEGTAAAEAMAMCFAVAGGHEQDPARSAGPPKKRFFVDVGCHPQTIGVVKTRAASMGIEITVGDHREKPDGSGDLCGVLVQYPATDGRIEDFGELTERCHKAGVLVVAACDLLALTLIKPPGEWAGGGADIAVGSAQRFGVPMGGGGPHAAFIATKNEYARRMPGRIIGVSKDAQGHVAYRMAIQTREQHIKRERATSNICTAQALLAIIAGMYAVYHGPEGLRAIARRVHTATRALRAGLLAARHEIAEDLTFDTLRVRPRLDLAAVFKTASVMGISLRNFGDGTIGISLDETTTQSDIADVLSCLDAIPHYKEDFAALVANANGAVPSAFARKSEFLTHPVFNTHHSETEMLRYIFKLQGRDLSLAHSMIPLGSCTMKLNATNEMLPVTWPEFGRIHPYAPKEQLAGYHEMCRDLEKWLAEITGFSATSLQPNAGSQGEYAGLLAIRRYHESRGEKHRNVCLIPDSAHGTNPASAVIAGMRVVSVENLPNGDISYEDLKAKAAEHSNNLACLMVTYPSTYGVFEEHIKDLCSAVHKHGGLVYMDGANMNAQVGLCRPGDMGADVCHLNLHKTFCIPHGGGGPGMGPICVAERLREFLPGDPGGKGHSGEQDRHSAIGIRQSGEAGTASTNAGCRMPNADSPMGGPVSAANYGSASILTISWMYIAMMGASGLKRATEAAILNANYMAARLREHYDVVFEGPTGRCAHEFIIDCRPFEKSAGVKSEDIAKRLMDYGFHAPTMSFPVPGTLMIEPTESEPKAELDRFCEAMIAIRGEIKAIEDGKMDRADNPLKHAPHTAHAVTADEWKHGYTREQAAWPLAWLRGHKFWPSVGRIDNAYGDRNLQCACPPVSSYS